MSRPLSSADFESVIVGDKIERLNSIDLSVSFSVFVRASSSNFIERQDPHDWLNRPYPDRFMAYKLLTDGVMTFEYDADNVITEI